jgi:hypothetical protein
MLHFFITKQCTISWIDGFYAKQVSPKFFITTRLQKHPPIYNIYKLNFIAFHEYIEIIQIS